MTAIEPSMQDWEALYAAAREFKEIACWKWMHDVNVFGVKDPTSDTIGYVCVMGRLGELFGLAVYLGSEGLALIRKLQFGEVSARDDEVMCGQRSLIVSFGERSWLQKRDHQIIKTLGLKLRGNTDWPLFRSYRPGYVPWFLTQEEVRFLTVVLQRAKEVGLRCKDDPDLLTPAETGKCLVQLQEAGAESCVWKDAWLSPVLEEAFLPAQSVNRVPFAQIRQKNYPPLGEWEVDVFFMPTGVRDADERPYYPRVLLCVEKRSGFILTTHLAGTEDYGVELQGALCDAINRHHGVPGALLVRNVETLALVRPWADELGLEVKLVKQLPALQEAKQELMRFSGLR